MARLKLGLLQVNHDRSVEVGDAFPDDSHRFRDLFDAQDQRFNYRVYMTIGGEVPRDLDEQDAYLITGSPLSVLDDLAFLPALYGFIRACDAARKPLLGACFGHQAIAVALGGRVERQAWNIGIDHLRIDTGLPWMTPAARALDLYQFHHDAVTGLPDGCTRYVQSDACAIAGFAKGHHIFTTQAHPEFTDPFMRCVLDATRPHLSPEDVARAESTLTRTARGDVFADWATRFFGGTP
ncbi:gamma-glutamyl-gamma-aminobutyrate hydrolase family protein [uncultured Tateyamaria sp.]|uniref:type 1 glutamine amidotransferase n=1 Tax=Tateyamaria sp. 1078 TaxID=3417464 RepID=UPI00261DF0F3|nr:gamma-glutamyl-gamma-aminobutyrate hydrolase family protein [uncultured Tateyamaria sp.]